MELIIFRYIHMYSLYTHIYIYIYVQLERRGEEIKLLPGSDEFRGLMDTVGHGALDCATKGDDFRAPFWLQYCLVLHLVSRGRWVFLCRMPSSRLSAVPVPHLSYSAPLGSQFALRHGSVRFRMSREMTPDRTVFHVTRTTVWFQSRQGMHCAGWICA